MSKRFLRIKSKAFILPSIITALSLLFGFLAILAAFAASFKSAAVFIFLSVIADNLDGMTARKLHATSEFGKNLDSLSDLIAFGMAPAVMIYTWGLHNIADEFGMIIAFTYLACGAVRLARFNTGVTNLNIPKNWFQGLPIPGAAGTIVTLCYIHPEPITSSVQVVVLIIICLVLSWLMVSSIPYPSDKNFNFRQANVGFIFLAFCLTLAFICYTPKIALAIGFIGYGLSGPILKLRSLFKRKDEETNNGDIKKVHSEV
jgi:CDP-diacylglycerol--serine O-phosphatidyltransferase